MHAAIQENRWLGWWSTPEPHHHQLDRIRRLSESEYEQWESARSTIRAFSRRHSYRLADREMTAFVRMHRAYDQVLEDRTVRVQDLYPDIVFSLEARLALALEAVRLFLNHTEADLKGRYGRDSAEVVAWKLATSNCYDNSFAYRFMYELRNCMHKRLPPMEMTLHDREVSLGVAEARMSVLFSPTSLLQRWDNWKALVRSDLQGRSQSFEVLPLVEELKEQVGSLAVSAMEIDLPGAITASEHLEKLAAEVTIANAHPVVFTVHPDKEEIFPGGSPQLVQLGIELIGPVRAAQQGRFQVIVPPMVDAIDF